MINVAYITKHYGNKVLYKNAGGWKFDRTMLQTIRYLQPWEPNSFKIPVCDIYQQ